jgi:hypothetical protein
VIDMSKVRERERFLDRVISSGDALREALAPYWEQKPKRKQGEHKTAYADRCRPYYEREHEHNAHRTAFVVEAAKQADAMLTNASRAYHDAWRAVSSS